MSELIKVKEVIKERGLTMVQVANRLGVSKCSLSQLANGNPTIESLHKVAEAIGCDIKDLIK